MTRTHRGVFGERCGAINIPLIFGSTLLLAFLIGVPQDGKSLANLEFEGRSREPR